MEKRNVIESGRTPPTTEKEAEVVDQAAPVFMRTGNEKTRREQPADESDKEKDHE